MILLFSVSLFLCCTVRSEHDVQEWVPLGEVGITLFLCVLLMQWACSLSEFPLVQNGCSAYIVQGKRLSLKNGFTIASYVIWELLKTLNGKFGGNFPNLELAVINYFLEIFKKNQGRQINLSFSLVNPFFLWKPYLAGEGLQLSSMLWVSATLGASGCEGSLAPVAPGRTESTSWFPSLHSPVVECAWEQSCSAPVLPWKL